MNERIIEFMVEKRDDALDKPLSAYLAQELVCQERIQSCRRACDRRQAEIEQRDIRARDFVRRDKQALAAQCRHWDVTFHPDASGGNDSTMVCNDCGLDAKDIERGRRLPTAKEEVPA